MFNLKATRFFIITSVLVLGTAGYLMLSGFENNQVLQNSPSASLLLSADDQEFTSKNRYQLSHTCSEIGEQKTGECTVLNQTAVSKATIKVDIKNQSGKSISIEPTSKIFPANASLNVMIEQYRVDKKFKNGSPLYLISYEAFYPFMDGSFRGICPDDFSDSCYGFDRSELSTSQIEWLKEQGSKEIIAQAKRMRSRAY